ncbi:aquaporin [Streptomyces luteogriseus]|nr:aquaporin [Streptomyces luteogriseus]
MTNGDIFVGEMIGTAVLVLFGAGVCAAVTLRLLEGTGPRVNRDRVRLGLRLVGRRVHRSSPFRRGHQPRRHLQLAVDPGMWSKVWVYLLGQITGAGYAINPARDLGPRIIHAILPIPNKGTSDWGYSWIPVVGPLIGGLLGGVTLQRSLLNQPKG